MVKLKSLYIDNNGIIKSAMPTTRSHNNNNNDPYAALRDLSFSRNTTNNTNHGKKERERHTVYTLTPLHFLYITHEISNEQ